VLVVYDEENLSGVRNKNRKGLTWRPCTTSRRMVSMALELLKSSASLDCSVIRSSDAARRD
jgi:hypothetical protein